MARIVTISTIGMRSERNRKPSSYNALLQERIHHLQREISQVLPDSPDLIVLPEFCDSPYRYGYTAGEELEYYRVRDDAILDFLGGIARENSCYITYPAFAETEGIRTNSTRVIGRTGTPIGTYDKNYLTLGEMQDYGLQCGCDAPLIPCDFGRVGCITCFDLHFNDLRLKYAAQKPDLLLFSSMYHGGLMQSYWAYSCRAHLVGAIWDEASTIVSPVGKIIAASTNYFNFVTARVNLDCAVAHLDFNWEPLNSMKKKYGAGVTIDDPGHLAAVLITNEMEDCTMDDLVKEFGIELLDEYLERAVTLRQGKIAKERCV